MLITAVLNDSMTPINLLLISSAGKAVPGRDVVVFVSHSGNTSECVAAATQLIRRGITTLALTGRPGIQSVCIAYSIDPVPPLLLPSTSSSISTLAYLYSSSISTPTHLYFYLPLPLPSTSSSVSTSTVLP